MDRTGQHFGNYRLTRLLGQGGFADVYLAEHLHLGTLAAIKVLCTRLSDGHVNDFRAEARIVARLVHPHIVRVLDFGVQDNLPYLVMSYAANGTLRQHHPRGDKLPLATVVSYVKQVTEALQYAHEQKLIHRDIKPDNMLIDERYQVLLSDFGISVMSQSTRLQSTQEVVGTVAYMAPEQLQGKPRIASDQYALGIVVYEWLCGERPFRGSFTEIYSQHLSITPPSLCAKVPDLPIAVERAVFTALAKDPQQRFSSILGFATALEEACSLSPSVPDLQSSSRATIMPSGNHSVPSGMPHGEVSDLPLVVSGPARQQEPLPAARPSETPQPSLFSTPSLGNAVRRLEPGVVPPAGPMVASTLPQNAKPQREERQRILAQLKQYWVGDVLDNSLQQVAASVLHQTSDLCSNLTLQLPDGSQTSLLPETPLVNLYDQVQGDLLITGEPGTGKTSLLLAFARDLLARAESDGASPIPIVCSLISWTMKPSSIEAWLTEELYTRYRISRKRAELWVTEPEMLHPLFDDLDEIPPEQRKACVEALAVYWTKHPDIPMLVCSRKAQLFPPEKFPFQGIVSIEPFTTQQVDTYLSGAGVLLRSLRDTLRADIALQELATNPFMLRILMLTYYHKKSVRDLLMIDAERRCYHVYARYSERMLLPVAPDTEMFQHGRRGLKWLARLMRKYHLDFFAIEQVKREWLMDARLRKMYLRRSLLLGMIPGLALGIVFGLFLWLVTGLMLLEQVIGLSILMSMIFGLIFGLIYYNYPGPGDLMRCLWRCGYSSKRDFGDFLNDAVQQHILHKVGNGYRFIHPLLQDYFASDDMG